MEYKFKELADRYAKLKEDQATKRGAMEAYRIQRDRAIQDFRNSVNALKSAGSVIIDDATRAKVNEVVVAAESMDFSQENISEFARALNGVIEELESHIEEQMK